jgi:hypothetical protein
MPSVPAPYPQVLTGPKGGGGGAPLVVVYHRHDGQEGWHIFSAYEEEACECRGPTDLASMLALDGSLAEVLDLPAGWLARRGGPGQPWRRQPIE